MCSPEDEEFLAELARCSPDLDEATRAANDCQQQEGARSAWYVDDDGTDGIGCGSVRSPCKTISYVETHRVSSGDTVHINAGTYTGSDNRIMCPYDNLVYEGAGASATVLDGTGVIVPCAQGWVNIHDRSNVTIRDLAVVDVWSASLDGGRAISATCDYGATCSDLLVQDVLIEDVWGPGIYVHADYASGSDWYDVEIYNNVISNACYGEIVGPGGAMEVRNECVTVEITSDFLVSYNYIEDCGKESIDVKNGSSSGYVHDNSIYGKGSLDPEVGIYLDGYNHGIHDIYVYNNLVSQVGHGSGVAIAHEQCGAVENIHVYNNIIHHNKIGILVVSPGDASNPVCEVEQGEVIDDLFVYYNTIADSTDPDDDDTAHGIDVRAGALLNAEFANNIVVDTEGEGVDVVAAWCEGPSAFVNNLYGEERFNGTVNCDYSNDDTYGGATAALNSTYHLLSFSDAINHADGTYTWQPSYDYDGDSRPTGLGSDIGADEYAP